MELGKDHLDTAQARLGLNVDRNAPAVVRHLDGAILVESDRDLCAGPGQSLIDGVVDDLPEAMHEPLAVGGSDIHTWTLAHRVQTFQNRQTIGTVCTARLSLAASHFPRCPPSKPWAAPADRTGFLRADPSSLPSPTVNLF